ncbi:DNA helicase (fragment) [Escherichia coli]
MANLLLQRAGETRQVTGSGGEDEVLMSRTGADKPEGHQTVLSRTVAGVICTALMASLSGRKVYWVGGIEGYRTEALEDLYWFSVDMPEKMQSDALLRDYCDFDEYCRIAKSTRDVEMNQAIRLLDICFPLPVKLKLLREHTVTSEKDADITVSTAHRSKGLEWPVVILDEDFADITDPLMPEDERRDETNLLYVAVTRARNTLVLNSLMRQLVSEQSQKAADTSPSENGENDAIYGQEGENA